MDPEEDLDYIDDEPLDAVPVPLLPVQDPAEKLAGAGADEARWADSLSATDRLRITTRGMMPGAAESDRAQALALLRRHGQRAMGTEDTAAPIIGRDERPTAGTTGVTQGVTLGWADEIGGAMRAQAGEGSYEQERDALRQTATRAREQAPEMMALGELAGSAPYMAIPGGGSSTLGRIGVQTGIGMGLGTASGAGYSEGETPLDVAEDAARGGVLGGVLGAGGQTLTEGAGMGLGALRRYAAGADRARVAAVAPGRGGQIEERIVREARDLPGGFPAGDERNLAGVAESLRRQGITGALSTPDDVVRQAEAATQRLDSDVLSPMYDRLDEIAPVPRDRLLGQLDELAAGFERDPELAAEGLARHVRRVTRRMRGTVPTHVPPAGTEGPVGPPVPRVPETLRYREARDLIEPIRQAARFSPNPATAARASRDAYSTARRTLDDIAAESLAAAEPATGGYRDAAGGQQSADDAVRAFQQARRDRVIAGFARRHAEDTGARQATRGMLGLREHLFAQGTGDSGGVGYLARAVGHRLANSAETGMRATGAELARSILERTPEALGPRAAQLQQALSRGGAAFAAAHLALSSRDPEYRRALEQASEQAEGQE